MQAQSRDGDPIHPPSLPPVADPGPGGEDKLSSQQQQEYNDRVLAYLDDSLKKMESNLKLQESASHSNTDIQPGSGNKYKKYFSSELN